MLMSIPLNSNDNICLSYHGITVPDPAITDLKPCLVMPKPSLDHMRTRGERF